MHKAPDFVIIIIEQIGVLVMFIQLEHDSDIALYEQLTRKIIEGIAKNDLKPGDKLPSVRNLAADLGVNMHTVSRSYAELEKKGILDIKPKSGAVIRELHQQELTEEQLANIERDIKPILFEGKALGVSEKQLQNLLQKVLSELQLNPSEGL